MSSASHLSVLLPEDIYDDSFRGTKCTRSHFVAGIDDTVFVYSLPSFDLIRSFHHEEPVSDLDVYENMLVTACEDDTLRIWDLVSGECGVYSSSGFQAFSILPPDPDAAWSEGPLIIMWNFYASNFRIWRKQSPQGSENSEGLLQDIRTYDHSIRFLEAKGRTAVTGTFGSTVHVWDLIEGNCRWVLIGHKREITSVALDHQMVYSESLDETIRVWSQETGDCCYILSSPYRAMRQSSPYVVYFPLPWTLHVWDSLSGKDVVELDNVVVDSFQHDDEKLVTVTKNGDLNVWDIRSGTQRRSLSFDPVDDVRNVFLGGQVCIALIIRDAKFFWEVWNLIDIDQDSRENQRMGDDISTRVNLKRKAATQDSNVAFKRTRTEQTKTRDETLD